MYLELGHVISEQEEEEEEEEEGEEQQQHHQRVTFKLSLSVYIYTNEQTLTKQMDLR